MKRIPAFTILELVFALLISSIILSVGYYGVNLVLKMFRAKTLKSEMMSELYLFNKAMNTDVEACQFITGDEDSLTMELSERTILYKLRPDDIIRQLDEISDTFRLTATTKHFSLVSENSPLIKGIRLNIRLPENELITIFSKHYSAVQVLNFEKKIAEHGRN